MSRATHRRSSKRLLPWLFALLLSPLAARGVDLDLKFEPGLALPVGKPQSDRFGLGGAATIKALAGFEGGYVNLAAGLTFLGLGAKSGFDSTSLGTAWAPSLGLRVEVPRESEVNRLQRPHAQEAFAGARPWVDGDFMYVRTGGLDRAGFAGAVGLAFPVGEARSFWLGPFVRYFQILQGNRGGFDNHDAKTIILGVSLETGLRVARSDAEPVAAAPPAAKEEVAPIPPPEPAKEEAKVEPPPPAARPDRDGDGVPDDIDLCPDVPGPASNNGCPIYKKVVVKPDKLELKEKIKFTVGDSGIHPDSYSALDEVAQALKDNKGFEVAIEGHASSEGGDENNQALSSKRAEAVLEYIASKGVSRDRLKSTGFSSSRPIESNDTESGRVANRRVEFIVHFAILKKGSAQ